MAADWTLPINTTAYDIVLSKLKDRDIDLAKQLDPSVSATPASLVAGMKRFNSSLFKWEKYNGTSWEAMAATYAIDISGKSSNVTGVVAIANGGTGSTTVAGWKTSLGLGALAYKTTISNTDWSGTALSVANGGTGSNSVAGAKTVLGFLNSTDLSSTGTAVMHGGTY